MVHDPIHAPVLVALESVTLSEVSRTDATDSLSETVMLAGTADEYAGIVFG